MSSSSSSSLSCPCTCQWPSPRSYPGPVPSCCSCSCSLPWPALAIAHVAATACCSAAPRAADAESGRARRLVYSMNGLMGCLCLLLPAASCPPLPTPSCTTRPRPVPPPPPAPAPEPEPATAPAHWPPPYSELTILPVMAEGREDAPWDRTERGDACCDPIPCLALGELVDLGGLMPTDRIPSWDGESGAGAGTGRGLRATGEEGLRARLAGEGVLMAVMSNGTSPMDAYSGIPARLGLCA